MVVDKCNVIKINKIIGIKHVQNKKYELCKTQDVWYRPLNMIRQHDKLKKFPQNKTNQTNQSKIKGNPPPKAIINHPPSHPPMYIINLFMLTTNLDLRSIPEFTSGLQ